MPGGHQDVQIGPPSTGGLPGGTVTHGSQLTINHVGPWTLQGVAKGSETLSPINSTQAGERIGTFPTDGRPSWIPGTDYVLNESSSNHGGVVPTGGMTIDGWFVPAGTWVAQFYDFQGNALQITGSAGSATPWPGVLFRGCRFRGPSTAPGFFNFEAVANAGITWVNYCDAGGISTDRTVAITESIFESQGTGSSDRMFIIRTYLSIAASLVFLRNNGDAAVENYCEKVPRYYADDTYHLNGIANSGAQTATLWLRNHMDFNPQPDYPTNPYYKSQNDLCQMAADGGAYPGTGTNLDGSTGYWILDNYLAGADHMLQLGVDKSNTSADVSGVNVHGNLMSTVYFEQGGQTGIAYKDPSWNVQSNAWGTLRPNVWADDYGTGSWDPVTINTTRQYPSGNGPRVGATISAPTGS